MREIPLTRDQVALVDDEFFEELSKYKWCAQKRKHGFHAARYDGAKYLYMHRVILKAPSGIGVDHKNGIGTDNRVDNLRLATKTQNGRAFRTKRFGVTSKFRGVNWHKGAGRWMARIQTEGQQTYLGLFIFEEEAARAYDKAALELFGEFAQPNFPV